MVPLMVMFRKMTTASLTCVPVVMLTLMALAVPVARIEAHPEPVPPSSVMALVIVTAP